MTASLLRRSAALAPIALLLASASAQAQGISHVEPQQQANAENAGLVRNVNTQPQAAAIQEQPQPVSVSQSPQPVTDSNQSQKATDQKSLQPVTVTQSPQQVISNPQPLPGQASGLQIPASGGVTDQEGVDTSMPWYYIHRNDYPKAQAAVARLHEEFPDWKTPGDLQQALAQKQIDQARDSHNANAVRAIAALHPEMFSCQMPYNMWTLADADYQKQDPSDAQAIYKKEVAQCDEPAILSTLDIAATKLPAPQLNQLVADARPHVTSEAGISRLNAEKSRRAASAGDWFMPGKHVNARRYAASVGPEILREHNAAGAAALGWIDYKDGRLEDSEKWFKLSLRWEPSSNALKGAILTAASQGHIQDVDGLTTHYRKFVTADVKRVLGGVYAEAASEAGRHGNIAATRRYAEKAGAYGNSDGWISLGWALYNAKQPAEAAQAFAKAGKNPNALKGRILSAAALGNMDEVDAYAKQTKHPDSDLRRALGAAYARAAGEAAQRGDMQTAQTYAERGEQYGDASGWDGIGWALLNQHHSAEALQMFAKAPDSESTANGRAIAMLRTGDLAGAQTLACGQLPNHAKLCGDVLAALADHAFKDQKWEETRQWAQEAQKYGVATRGTMIEDGWAAYRLGRYQDSANIFQALYKADPDRDSADGLVNSLMAEGRDDEASQLAIAQGGALAQSYRHMQAGIFYAQKQFVAANNASPGAYPELTNISSAWVGGGVALRDREGTAGQYRIDSISEYLYGGQAFGNNILDARIENTDVDIGKAHPGDPVGSASTAWTRGFNSTANLDTPTVRYRYQGNIAYEAEISTTPLGGATTGRPTGDASVTFNHPYYAITGTLYSATRWDSLLSASGMTDPVTGDNWGRVTENGGQANGYVGLGGNWSLNGRLLGSYIDGVGVADNSRITAGAGVNYTFHIEGFDYVRAGPLFTYESYDKNEDHFTLGNGGYYSPQMLAQPALGAEFLTAEGKRWQIWGRGDIGYNIQHEDASPYFPLAGGGGPIFGASDDNGVAGDLAIKAGYLLTPHWIANAYAWTSLAPDYTEAVVGAGITYSFDPRTAVMSSDLPEDIGQSRY